jgi:hypothetical protein
MLFAAVRWSLLAHSVISLRCKICPLSDNSGQTVDFGRRWFVRF